MKLLTHVSLLALAAVCTGLVGCASTRPVAYSGVASAPLLAANPHDETGRIPYAYSAHVDLRKYTSVLVDPVVIYDGADQQFDKVPMARRQLLADYLREQVCAKLATHYQIVNASGPETLRIKITLAGAEGNVVGLGTFTRLDLAGLAYNIVQSIRGKEGAFTGSVFYAMEITDSSTDRLLSAYVEKQYPNALNIAATFGKWDAAKTGIRKGAKDLDEQLREH